MMMLPAFDYTVPTVQSGDLYQLGRHYLLCGDSTNEGDVMRFLPYQRVGHLVRAIITDPPYGEIQAEWDKAKPSFGWIRHVRLLYEPEATAICFCSLPYGFTLVEEMAKEGWQFRFDLVWQKGNAGFKTSSKLPLVAHEHLFAFAEKGIPASQLTFNGYEAGEAGEKWIRNTDTSSRHREVYAAEPGKLGREDGQRWTRSVLDGKKKPQMPVSMRTTHPSQKPLELVEKLVLLLTNQDQVVYDPFLGSGTTLLACEKTGRACLAIEQSPEYCQMAIERWMKLTGQEPVRICQISTKGAQ